MKKMNNEITEELTKRIVEEYGKDEWYAVAQMSYPHLVELCLTLRRQMRLASEGRLWEKEEMSNKLTIEEARKVALEAIAKEKAMYEALNNEEDVEVALTNALSPAIVETVDAALYKSYYEDTLNQLSWLLGRLEAISDRNVVAKILEDYEARLEK